MPEMFLDDSINLNNNIVRLGRNYEKIWSRIQRIAETKEIRPISRVKVAVRHVTGGKDYIRRTFF